MLLHLRAKVNHRLTQPPPPRVHAMLDRRRLLLRQQAPGFPIPQSGLLHDFQSLRE
jgi:hypothetical protein